VIGLLEWKGDPFAIVNVLYGILLGVKEVFISLSQIAVGICYSYFI
jgi:hypothetical protein